MEYQSIVNQAWPDWEIEKQLGAGSYGCVFQAKRTDLVGESHAAIKVVRIPQDESELEALRMEGYSDAQTRAYLEKAAKDFAA